MSKTLVKLQRFWQRSILRDVVQIFLYLFLFSILFSEFSNCCSNVISVLPDFRNPSISKLETYLSNFNHYYKPQLYDHNESSIQPTCIFYPLRDNKMNDNFSYDGPRSVITGNPADETGNNFFNRQNSHFEYHDRYFVRYVMFGLEDILLAAVFIFSLYKREYVWRRKRKRSEIHFYRALMAHCATSHRLNYFLIYSTTICKYKCVNYNYLRGSYSQFSYINHIKDIESTINNYPKRYRCDNNSKS